ncbi:Rossmann-like and DUF2520 domain-containing protein [Gracilimonas halophila]|uniref:Rossmann-like and DUF2520 domain-containing protein n=1 Tax=Gracilimonas halophila TaxID=1834464 RepID=A0ABW5JI45_9BACT
MNEPRVSIIGLGQVGTALLNAFSGCKVEVVSVFNRSEINPSVKGKFPNSFFGRELPGPEEPMGDFIILAVSDDAIKEVAEKLSEILTPNENLNVIHCSGTHSSQILKSLKRKGANIASFHPIKAITSNTVSFKNIWFDIEGDEELLGILEKLAELLGASSFRVEPEAKPFLHASAVVASNYLVVLADLVSRISSQGNIPEHTAIKALAPLMESTLSNITELGVTDSLTGPIARGDAQTVEKHLQSLESVPKLQVLYKTLGLEALQIAERKSGHSSSLGKIKELLS